jgi:glycosidase
VPRQPRYPSLYQVNTRVWLWELSERLGRAVTLADVPDEELDRFAALGFDWLWLLGVWQTGPAGRAVSRAQPQWRHEFEALLPDLTEDDITGSPFAVRSYTAHADFGGDEALAGFRERLRRRGLLLVLDFVPNHTALDHPWAWQHPEYYLGGGDDDLAREPQNYVRIDTHLGPRVLAHGRDPYFPGWPDTLQLNCRSAAVRGALLVELDRIADRCDGVRCDMAMLLLPDVIRQTWGDRSRPADGSLPVDAPVWPEATARVRGRHPEFLFLAEVYWDREWTLQQQGFDYTYDKKLYDRLHARDTKAVRGHLCATPEFQSKSARFLENHDEPRAASAFPPQVHGAAAVVTFLVPGLRFFHEGQFEGRRRRASVHLRRRPAEPTDEALRSFYLALLESVKLPAVRDGSWELLECRSAWADNATWKQFLAFLWQRDGDRLLVAVNYGHVPGQCYVRLPVAELRGRPVLLRDRLSAAVYQRDGTELVDRGLYLDLPEWGRHVFAVG